MRAAFIAGLLLAAATQVQAGAVAVPDTQQIPDPNLSTWDSLVGRSPRNVEVGDPMFQYSFHGVVRNQFGAPIAGWPASDIALEIISPCQNPVVLHPDNNTDVNGRVVWGPAKLDQGGGSCGGPVVAVVRFISIGIYKTYHQVTSPDEDGNGAIALPDLSVFQQAFVTGGPSYQGDLNLSGGVPDLGDLAFFQHHFVAQ